MVTLSRGPSSKFSAGVVAGHVVATPTITWLAMVYSAVGAPWREVAALWHAQAVLLGAWYGLNSASPRPRRWLALTGLLWLCAMPTAKELSQRGVLPFGSSWTSLILHFGLQPLYLFLSFAAAAFALTFAKTLWPRWRVVTLGSGSSAAAPAPQFSIKQLMIAITGCTPVLLLAKLAHDHLNLFPVHSLATLLLSSLFGIPSAAAIAFLSMWAALGRRFLAARLAIAASALLVVVLLASYAEKYPSTRIVGYMVFEVTQLAIVVATLLLFRWNGYRIETAAAIEQTACLRLRATEKSGLRVAQRLAGYGDGVVDVGLGVGRRDE